MAKPKLEQKAKVGGLPTREEFYGQQGQRARLNRMKKRRRGRAAAKRSGPSTYTISGSVQDSGASPIEGALVTLTGDASDSFVTLADGLYSFDVPNGSYTVTPTKSGYVFAPTSSAETVAGGPETADFVATQLLTLPYTFNFDAETTGLTPSWVTNNASGSDVAVVGEESVEGHSKHLFLPKADGGCQAAIDLGGILVPANGIRVQWLHYLDGLYAYKYLYFLQDGENDYSNRIYVLLGEHSSNFAMRSLVDVNSVAYDTGEVNPGGGLNGTGNAWKYTRMEWNPADDVTWPNCYSTTGGGSSGYPKSLNHSQQPVPHPDWLSHIYFISQGGWYHHKIAECWIGDLTTAWPTPGVPTS